MKTIYKIAEKRGIKLYPYDINRLNNTKKRYIIPDNYAEKMSIESFKKYLEALGNVQNEEANGLFGWVGAYKVFEELGFTRKERVRGHRVFISYSFNQAIYKERFRKLENWEKEEMH